MMEEDISMTKLPAALCFKREDFIMDDFNIDQFVGNCRKYASLETMHKILGSYHKILCASMVELINKDYVDFVNLSSNLVGLDKCIRSLASPLDSLKNEIDHLKHSLDETMESACTLINERTFVHETKLLAHRVLCVLEGLEKISLQKTVLDNNKELSNQALSLDILERIALEYNLVRFHMNKMVELDILCDKKEVVQEIEISLLNHLECLFLMGLSKNDAATVRKVLQIFSTIDKERHAELCFCDEIVKPHMSKIVTEEIISKKGLSQVFSDILGFVRNHCGLILDVTRGVKTNYEVISGYDFLVNAVWPEVIKHLEYIAPVYIFNHGNPEVFHKNFCASMTFLDDFEHCLVVQASVKRFRAHPSYAIFMRKWNLDVYFQIRFQETARIFENSLLCPFSKPTDGIRNRYLLSVTFSLWFCLCRCWSMGFFLVPLFNNFWRLTIQLISRYTTWARSMLNKELENKEGYTNQATFSESKHKLNKSMNQDDNVQYYPGVVQLARLIKDMDILIAEVEILYKTNILLKFPEGAPDTVKDAFQESKTSLEDVLREIKHHIIGMLIKQCSPHLKLITDIPRLYRKTNREVPSKPSPYVAPLLLPLVQFLQETNLILSEEWQVHCLNGAVDELVKLCHKMMANVLTSIKKMEDSLKRLKRAREKPTEPTAAGVMTDDDKIRRQLLIDVTHICKQMMFGLSARVCFIKTERFVDIAADIISRVVDNLGLNCSEMESYQQLENLVSSAERNHVDSNHPPC